MNETATATGTTEYRERDKYGRTVYHVCKAGEHFRTKVVIVVLPKSYVEAYPDSGRYLVNDWQLPVWAEDGTYVGGEEHGKITYVRTLKEARALAASRIVK